MALWFAFNRYQSFAGYVCKSDVLLINRYVLSNAVYQSIRSEADLYDWIMELEHVHLDLPRPDVYVCLDVAPSQASCNVEKKGFRDYVGERKDVYEQDASIQHRCRAKYMEYAAKHGDIEIVSCMDNDVLLAAEAINTRIVNCLARRNLI
ncbi:Thymidylate kinase [bioreactor metagenome]|uniref:Thymidylate kinase n=1 Tax=bioreactor metagenome TaxID=1076179 RepID=A0A645GFQ9_9ZZZZ